MCDQGSYATRPKDRLPGLGQLRSGPPRLGASPQPPDPPSATPGQPPARSWRAAVQPTRPPTPGPLRPGRHRHRRESGGGDGRRTGWWLSRHAITLDFSHSARRSATRKAVKTGVRSPIRCGTRHLAFRLLLCRPTAAQGVNPASYDQWLPESLSNVTQTGEEDVWMV